MQRRETDTILIGDEIRIQILECSRGHVKLGLEVPKRLAIVRGEMRAVSEQNRSAAQGVGAEIPSLLARRLRAELGTGCEASSEAGSPVGAACSTRHHDGK
ncbi:MAG: carbon storage regulator [Paludibaculum sp.]